MPHNTPEPQDNTPDKKDGWNEWSRYVLKELEEQKQEIKAFRTDIQELRIQMTAAQTKVYFVVSILGLLGGTIGAAIVSSIMNVVLK